MSLGKTSLRWRLLVGTLVWIVAALVGASWMLQTLFEQHLARQFDAELTTHLGQLAANLEASPEGRPLLARPLSDPRLERPYAGLYWQVDRMGAGAAGIAVLRSRSLWDANLQVPEDHLADGELHTHRVTGPGGETLRMIEQVMRPAEAPEQAWRLIVAGDEHMLSQPVVRFRNLLVVTLSVLAAGLVAAAVFQVIAGLRPLKHLRDELARLRDGEQTTLSNTHPREVQPLVDELNALLIRNAEFVERARSQAGNLAHAVKTPLAVIANAAVEEGGPLSELVLTQVGYARQQIDRHLAMARVAATAQDKAQRCAVLPVLEGLIRVMERLHPDRRFRLLAPKSTAAVFRGEAQDLQEMVGNLLDNAGKWAKTEVQVRVVQDAAVLYLDIDDDGPGVAVEQRPLVLKRGRCADENAPGSGLGLAIVEDLAELYGGRLELLDGSIGGLRARLTLPAWRAS